MGKEVGEIVMIDIFILKNPHGKKKAPSPLLVEKKRFPRINMLYLSKGGEIFPSLEKDIVLLRQVKFF